MKKIILVLSLMFLTMSSFNTSENIRKLEKQQTQDPCVLLAWDAADKWCARRTGGCSEYQEWLFTDIAYNVCTGGL